MFYSKSTAGFYSHEIHGDNIPSDAVEISSAEHAALIDGQSNGKRIVADENGFPVLADPPAPSQAELDLARIAELKQLLVDSDYKVLPDYDKPNEEIIAQRQAWRDEIRELENQA